MSLFTFSVPAEYFNAVHDVMRMVSIQVVVQFLFAVVNAKENPFFSILFLQTIMFVVIGVLFYWLIVQYLIQFEISDNRKPSNTYSPATYKPLTTPDTNIHSSSINTGTYEGTHEETHDETHDETHNEIHELEETTHNETVVQNEAES